MLRTGGTVKRLLLLGVAAFALVAPGTVAASTITTVMQGLDNAKGLAFGPEGALYVAEAGRGGPASGLCWTSPRPDLGLRCYGATGAISRYWHGTQERIVIGSAVAGEPGGHRAGGRASAHLLPGTRRHVRDHRLWRRSEHA